MMSCCWRNILVCYKLAEETHCVSCLEAHVNPEDVTVVWRYSRAIQPSSRHANVSYLAIHAYRGTLFIPILFAQPPATRNVIFLSMIFINKFIICEVKTQAPKLRIRWNGTNCPVQ